MAPRMLHDDDGSQPLTEARGHQQGPVNPNSCASTGLKRSSDGHDATRTGLQHLSDSHVGMYIGLWLLSARHVSTLLHPPVVHLDPLLTSIKGRSMALVQKGGRAGGRADERALSLSLANACNPLLQVHPPWAQDNTRPRFPLTVSPLCSVSRRPIWVGTHGDNLLVGPGTPRGRNADNTACRSDYWKARPAARIHWCTVWELRAPFLWPGPTSLGPLCRYTEVVSPNLFVMSPNLFVRAT
jgi:hypothetical protein